MKIRNILMVLMVLALGACGDKKANLSLSKPSFNTADAGVSEELHEVTSNVNGEDVTLTSVHFGFDKYDLSSEMKEVNRKNAGIIDGIIKSKGSVKIKLEGNSDEWGTDEYNQALGLSRAKSVKDALVRVGISKSLISTVSLGESSPICEDKTAKCWKLNRRVDYKLIP